MLLLLLLLDEEAALVQVASILLLSVELEEVEVEVGGGIGWRLEGWWRREGMLRGCYSRRRGVVFWFP